MLTFAGRIWFQHPALNRVIDPAWEFEMLPDGVRLLSRVIPGPAFYARWNGDLRDTLGTPEREGYMIETTNKGNRWVHNELPELPEGEHPYAIYVDGPTDGFSWLDTDRKGNTVMRSAACPKGKKVNEREMFRDDLDPAGPGNKVHTLARFRKVVA